MDHINTNYPFDQLRLEKVLEKSLIDEIEKKITNNLTPLPKVWVHGDFTIFNLFPNGIIDLEDSHINHMGYDVFSLLTHVYRFPQHLERAERKRSSTFTAQQVEKGIKFLSIDIDLFDQDIFASLFLYRGARSTQKMNKTPVLRDFRYTMYKKIAMMFLN